MPEPAPATQPTRQDLAPSPALSILKNPPTSFAGRKVGALVTDGTDAALLVALKVALTKEGALLKLVAPMVGGIEASDGTWIAADEKIDGGPSVVFDAVLLLPSTQGAALLADEATARDFVADAWAHLKIIGHVDAAVPLLRKAGVPEGQADEGLVSLRSAADAEGFVAACRKLRIWQREALVKRV
jgi:catalase